MLDPFLLSIILNGWQLVNTENNIRFKSKSSIPKSRLSDKCSAIVGIAGDDPVIFGSDPGQEVKVVLNFCIFLFIFYALCAIISMIVRPQEFFTVYQRTDCRKKRRRAPHYLKR